jgi:hypothetical protein
MHSIEIIQEIDRLLRRGDMSQREIAAQVGVSRGTVSALASGRRGLHGKHADDASPASQRSSARPVRCPECGYRVYFPCLICSARAHRLQGPMRILPDRNENGR